MHQLERAIGLAVKAHAGQVDKTGRPYILHPLKLMSQMDTDEARLAALLHDVVEDTDYTLAALVEELSLSDSVALALRLLTHDKSRLSYDDYLAAIKPHDLARQVKLADLRDNMDVRRLKGLSERDVVRLEKYQRSYLFLTNTAC